MCTCTLKGTVAGDFDFLSCLLVFLHCNPFLPFIILSLYDFSSHYAIRQASMGGFERI